MDNIMDTDYYTVRVLTEDGEVEEQNTFDNISDAETEFIECEGHYIANPAIYSVQLFYSASGDIILETYCG